MTSITTNRRTFLSGTGAMALSLKYGAVGAADGSAGSYKRWEDIMRNKWTWDRVVRGSRGLNCTGHCAFNIYVRNGIVWREEQQGEYGHQGARHAGLRPARLSERLASAQNNVRQAACAVSDEACGSSVAMGTGSA